jgi:mannose-6-phosphate isomerase
VASSRLAPKSVAKPWGRHDLGPGFASETAGEPIGEIWFPPPSDDSPLLAKFLFTSARLSVQVHPDDAAAARLGQTRGKDEAWLVLDADPGATIALGFNRACTAEEVRAAALDGTIEDLLAAVPVSAGDFLFSPAGTVHAIGAGLHLLEIQQNLDLTYRLYDYGRPRPLHVEEAIAVADRRPWSPHSSPGKLDASREILLAGPSFVVERWTVDGAAAIDSGGDELILIPLAPGGTLDGDALAVGAAWTVRGCATLRGVPGAEWVVAYAGGDVRADALTHGT